MRQIIPWLRYNAVTMFISLLLALIVWIIAYQNENRGITNSVDNIEVSTDGLAEGYRITNQPDSRVDVTLFAQEDIWPSLNEDSVTAELDLTGLETGTWDVPVSVSHPDFTAIIEVEPAVVEVVIERIETRELPVQVEVDGRAAIGFRQLPPTVTPSTAIIEGPESVVQQVSELRVTISLGDERRQTYQEDRLPIVALDAEGNEVANITLEPATVSATVEIQQEADIKEVSIQPLTINSPQEGYLRVGIIPIPDTAVLQGDPDVLDGISVVYTEVFDIGGLTEDRRFTVELNLPEGVRALDQDENEIMTIDVIVSVEPIRTVEELSVPVRVINLADGLSAELPLENITVILRGPQRELNSLIGGENVIATINAEGLTDADTYQLTPEIEIIGFEDIEVVSTIPAVVTVDIIEE